MIRTLIADDVALAREAIRVWLSEEPDVQVVGEAANGNETVEAVRTLCPALLFLDVRMPGLDGFSVLERTALDCDPAVIFMTAYDRYAVKAFEANAVDYLLKPISRKRFGMALERARRFERQDDRREPWHQVLSTLEAVLAESRRRLAAGSGIGPAPPKFAVKDRDLTVLLRADEIDWVEAAGNSATVHCGAQQFPIRMSITDMEARLLPSGFARISRSALVNTDRIHGFKSLWHGDCQIYLRDGTTLRLSRRYRAGVLP